MMKITKTKYLQEIILLAMLLLAACYARTRLPADDNAPAALIQPRR